MKTISLAQCLRGAEQFGRSATVPDWLSALLRHGHQLSLFAIVLGAMSVALLWVFLVPIYQAPDEALHLDYALSIKEHGGLFRVHHTSWKQLEGSVHPYTTYLIKAIYSNGVVLDPEEKVSPNYGTRDFYATLERNAPRRDNLRIDMPNKPFVVYPFGYYSLLAIWIGFLHLFNDGPVFTVFGARILSALLLGVSLVLVSATLRRLHFKPSISLLITAAIGFFPLTSFLASSVQPDNLSFTIVSAAFYLALRAREAPDSSRLIGLLGLTLGALLVTKQHFFLCVLLSTVAMLATRIGGITRWRRLKLAMLLFWPPLLSGSLHLWLTWGSTNYYGPPASYTTNCINHTLHGLQRAFLDYYAGMTHDSFWGLFGWVDMPLVIRGKNTTEAVQFVIQVFSWLILGLTLWRLEQVGSRLVRLSCRGRRALALRLAFSDPLLNSYFLFTVFMFYIYIRIDNRFGAQGRNWWPLLLPIFLAAITYAPKALMLSSSRIVLSAVITVGLTLYGAVGSYYALASIKQRYYGPRRASHGILVLLPFAQEGCATQARSGRNSLNAEEMLKPGEWLRSKNGDYKLTHQKNGNVVLTRVREGQGPIVLWQTGTVGYDTSRLVIQPDGNLVLYQQNTAIWHTGSVVGHHLDIKLQLTNDGNLSVFHDEKRLWTSGARRDRLQVGESLLRGQALKSPNGEYTLVHQGDGNVVLYRSYQREGQNVLWKTRTSRQMTTRLVLQGDGNLVLYEANHPVWSLFEKPRGRQLNVELRLEDDGKLAIYENGRRYWLAGTVQ